MKFKPATEILAPGKAGRDHPCQNDLQPARSRSCVKNEKGSKFVNHSSNPFYVFSILIEGQRFKISFTSCSLFPLSNTT